MMAINTLFGFMWLNDWESILLMYQLIDEHSHDSFILCFFISFFVISQYIILNILVAFVIDVYSSMDENLRAEKEQLKEAGQ